MTAFVAQRSGRHHKALLRLLEDNARGGTRQCQQVGEDTGSNGTNRDEASGAGEQYR